jgi:hypothetical protein
MRTQKFKQCATDVGSIKKQLCIFGMKSNHQQETGGGLALARLCNKARGKDGDGTCHLVWSVK